MSSFEKKIKHPFTSLSITCIVCLFPKTAESSSAVARFHAAEIILGQISHDVTHFQYPNVNTSDFAEVISPYTELLKDLHQALRKEGQLSDHLKAQKSFFCTAGITNLKQLIMRGVRTILLPSQPGDSPDKLKKIHAPAIEFFNSQDALADVIPELLNCEK